MNAYKTAPRGAARENYLLLVLSIAFVMGMGVAIGVYLAWSRGALSPAFTGAASWIALLFCPPYILSVAVGPTNEPTLALALVVGTMVFANASLYAGVAAGIYHVVMLLMKRRRA